MLSKTELVRFKGTDQEVLINVGDFDEDVHERLEASESEGEGDEDDGDGDEDSEPQPKPRARRRAKPKE